MDKAKHDEPADGSAAAGDESSAKKTSGKQSSATSGTTPLSSESPASNQTAPGGVEGESGNS